MKCLKSYVVESIYGKYEIAESVNGLFYYRDFGFNGYGVGWLKWVNIGRLTRFSRNHEAKSIECVFDAESKRNIFIINFKHKKNAPNYRLPNF